VILFFKNNYKWIFAIMLTPQKAASKLGKIPGFSHVISADIDPLSDR